MYCVPVSVCLSVCLSLHMCMCATTIHGYWSVLNRPRNFNLLVTGSSNSCTGGYCTNYNYNTDGIEHPNCSTEQRTMTLELTFGGCDGYVAEHYE